MSIIADARLRLLEARIAKIELRLAELATAPGAAVTDAAAAGPKPRIGVQKLPKRPRKAP